MTLTNADCRTLIGLLSSAKDGQEAKAILQMWFDEKSADVYKEGWLDACEEYDVQDTMFSDEDDSWEGIQYEGY